MNNNEAVDNQISPSFEKVRINEPFSYEGYQIVRSEFFAHISEPSIVFNKGKIYANTACVNKLPEADYVQFLVNSDEMKLVIRPCTEDEKDAFLWSTINKKNGRKQPRQITGRIFFAKLAHMTGWNPEYRYKVLGKMVKSSSEYLFVFNLNSAQCFIRNGSGTDSAGVSKVPRFPAQWQNQFGLSVEEHKRSLYISKFNEYTIFGIADSATERKG